jgi:ketosteroid isomerase-like protein
MATDPHQIAQQFQAALQRMEQTRNVEDITGFFSDDAELSNLGAAHGLRGAEGVRQFWRNYLQPFSDVRSEFYNSFAGDGTTALEWRSEGTLTTGQPISYRGVSVLVLNDAGKVREFRTYYDSAAFVAKPAAGANAGAV